jgi:hypothetical protein
MTSTYVIRPLGGTLVRSSGGGPVYTLSYGATVFIGGASVFCLSGTLSADSKIGSRGVASFSVVTTTSTHFAQYQRVSILDGNGVLIFSGFIDQLTETKPGFGSTLVHQITCMDQRWVTDKRVIYQSTLAPDTSLAPSTSLAPGGTSSIQTYTNRPYDVIVQDIYNKYLAPEGISLGMIFTGPYPSPSLAPSISLAPNGPSQMIGSVVFNYPTVTQALDALVTSASALGVTFYWTIDQNKQFWFVPYSYVVNSTVIDGTQIDSGQLSGVLPSVSRANPLFRDTQYVVGGTMPGPGRTSYFTGDGTTRTWTLSYPVAEKPYVILNGTSKSVGIQGTTGQAYYFQVGSTGITQDSSQTALINTDSLEVHYTPQLPSTASAQNSAAIAAQAILDGTTGIVESVVKDTNITSNADGVTEANQLLNVYSPRGTQFTFATRASGYFVGQQVTVTYAPWNFSNTKMLIESVHIADLSDQSALWYTITAIIGPYDTSWPNFFGKLLAPSGSASASAISVGV